MNQSSGSWGAGMRRAVACVGLVAALCALAAAGCRTKRQSALYRFDSETRGWVVIVFNQPKAPPLPMQGDALLLDVPRSGLLSTSTKSPVGYARDAFLVRYPDGSDKPLPPDSIRANHVGTSTLGDGKPLEFETMFLGSEAELRAGESEERALSRARTTLLPQ